MRKNRWIQIGCVLAAACIVGGGSLLVKAGETVDVESAVAGAAVPLNNYFASSLNPEAELRAFLDSDAIVNFGQDGNGVEDPVAPIDETAEEPTVEETMEEETTGEEISSEETGEEETSPEETTEEETTEEQTTETPTEPETEPETESVSRYADVAVSHVRKDSYVNVRTEPNTNSKVLGKLYNDCAATILNTVDGEDGQWYEIKSGSVHGYIKSEYFLTGAEAEARAIEIGKLEGRVNTGGLRLRTEPNTDAHILTKLWEGEKYIVIEEGAEWVKLMIDDDLEGYVARQYVDITLKFDTAISLEEERKQKEEEERKRKEAEEAAKRLEEAKRAEEEAKRQEEENKNNGGDSGSSSSSGSSSEVTSASRDALVAYAMQWVGVSPYVYGGTSLQNGIDCSAFVQAIYKNVLGKSIPRDSRSQAKACTQISEGDLQPGDLVFYNSGGSSAINHVAMYIGGGKIVHASNSKLGTIVSNMKYREPCMYGRFIN